MFIFKENFKRYEYFKQSGRSVGRSDLSRVRQAIHFGIVLAFKIFGRIYKTGSSASSKPISILRKPNCYLV